MIQSLEDFSANTFDQTLLTELQPAFDLDLYACDDQDLVLWFQNFLKLSQYNIGLAHCVQQHQTARNCLSFAHSKGINITKSAYHDQIGCFSTNHDIDTITLEHNFLSGSKYWVTAADRADFAVIKVGGQYTDQPRQLVYVDLHDPAIEISNSGFEPIGMTIASPMTVIANGYQIESDHVIHTGNFQANDAVNEIQSFAKYAFLTNYIGCAAGLYTSLADNESHQLDYELRRQSNCLAVVYRFWEDNVVSMSRRTDLDKKFWATYDGIYNTTKQIIASLLSTMLITNNSRTYNKNSAEAQQFLDAVVWLSHGRSPYHQVMSDA